MNRIVISFLGWMLGAIMGVVCVDMYTRGVFSPERGSKAWMQEYKCVLTNEYDHVWVERKNVAPELKPLAPYVQRQYDCEKGVMFARVLGGYDE